MSEGTEIDAGQPAPSPARKIRAEITAYEKRYKKWKDRGEGILDRYEDERPEPVNQTFVLRKYNILWANVRVLKPTLYARIPEVQVERRFKDADPVGKLASEIAERMGNYILQTSDADDVFKQCVQDVCLPGRGVAWVNYEVEGEDKPVMEDYADEKGAPAQRPKMKDGTDEPETEFEKIHESVNPSYIDWRDFGHSPVRTWKEVDTVWCARYLDKQELIERFGAKQAETIPLDRQVKDEKNTDNIVPQATIYECWHKPTRKVYWLHKEVEGILDESDPPVELEGFWPTPRPLFATMTNRSLIPKADFIFYQDQANELDIVTNRIARITDAIKAVGVYDASVPALERILQPNGSPDNLLVPVDQWAAFAEKGGIAGAIQLVPIDMLSKVLIELYAARDQIKQTIYDVTGIADIIRGSTDPNETLGAQKLKGQFGSINIRDRQADVAAFCRDVARLIIECGIQMFEPQLIADMTQAVSFCPLSQQEQLMQQMGRPFIPQSFQQALKMLRDDKMRSFHIDIETDSTVALNEAEEKQSVIEFTSAMGQFFTGFGPIIQEQPALAPVIGELLLYASRRFRAGRALEASIEKAVGNIVQQAQQPKPPPPQLQIAQAKAQGEQARAQADVQKSQAQVQVAHITASAAQQGAQQTAQKNVIDMQKSAGELKLKAQGQQFDQAMTLDKQNLEHRAQAHQEFVDHVQLHHDKVALNKPVKHA